MKTRVFSFVSTIITFVLSCVLTFCLYKVNIGLPNTGLESLSKVILIPIIILLYLMLVGLLGSTIITAIRSMMSGLTAIKVISIILLVLTIVVLGFAIYTFTLLL